MPDKRRRKLTFSQVAYRKRIVAEKRERERERIAKLTALKRAGLYSGSLKKRTTTKYQRQVLKQGEQYLRANASKVEQQHRLSRRERHVLAKAFPELLKIMNHKLIAKQAYKGQRVVIRKDKEIVSLSKYGMPGQELDIEVRWIKPGQTIPALDPKLGETYVLPLWRGPNRPLHYIYETDLEALLKIANKYQSNSDRPYENATDYIQIRSIKNFKPTYIPGQEKAMRKAVPLIKDTEETFSNDNFDDDFDDFDDFDDEE